LLVIKKLKNLYWSLKLKYILWYYGRINNHYKKMRKKYCAKGFHKLRINKFAFKEWKKRERSVTYLKCVYCEYCFFVSKSHKEKYLKLRGNPKRNPLCDLTQLLKQVGSGGDSK